VREGPAPLLHWRCAPGPAPLWHSAGVTAASRPDEPVPGPTNSLVDVAGLRVGHATRRGDGSLTGVTVVLPPDEGAVAGVDVRGGGPGTRETDLLDPRNSVERVHAVVLTGGSAYGLAAADGVMARLEAAGVGHPVGPAGVVPIVPAAVVFDLARGGEPSARPGPAEGEQAYDAASASPPAAGCVGAGTGAVAGGLKGGVGSASSLLPDGSTVAALVVVNSVGSTVDWRTGELWGAGFGLGDEFAGLRRPDPAEVPAAGAAARAAGLPILARPPGTATTLVVLATDVALSKAGCAKLAGIGHDGLARAIRPVHTMHDGDTAFALSTAARPEPDLLSRHRLLEAAGDCVTRAVAHAMLAATSATTPAGTWPAYLDALPSARDVSAGTFQA